MKRWLCVWAFTSVAMWGQNSTGVAPNSLPDADPLQSLDDAFRHGNALPSGAVIIVPKARSFEIPSTAQITPEARLCVVPLLVVPIHPNVDRQMVIHPPKSAFEGAGIVKGLPVCSTGTAK